MTELHYKDAVHWAQCLNVRLQVRTHKSLQFLILTMCLIIWFSQVHQFYIKRLFPPMWFLHHCSTQSHVSVRKIWGCTVALELLSNGVASACDSSASESTSWHHDACFAKPRQSPYSTQWHDQIKKTKQKKHSARQFLRKSNVGMRIYQSGETSD